MVSGEGLSCLFGEGVGPWKKLFAAAESEASIEYYLIEQEGSEYSEMETAQRCLATYRKFARLKIESQQSYKPSPTAIFGWRHLCSPLPPT